jgi:hypothetical protein
LVVCFNGHRSETDWWRTAQQQQPQVVQHLSGQRGREGVEAFTTLWKAVARLATTTTTTTTTTGVETDATEAIVVALPDCDKRILVNWKELLDWIQDTMLDQVRIETTLLEDNQAVRTGSQEQRRLCHHLVCRRSSSIIIIICIRLFRC